MKKIVVVILFCMFLSIGCATAQTTWNGLRFGMSVKEAQDAMATKGIAMVASNPQVLKSVNDFNLSPGITKTYPVMVALSFDGTGLRSIVLELDISELRKHEPSSQSDRISAWIFANFAYKALLGKYGKPVSQWQDCAAQLFELENGCSADWRGDNQTVSFVLGTTSSNRVFIAYAAQPAQL